MAETRERIEGMNLQEIKANSQEVRTTSRRALQLRSNPSARINAAIKIAELEPSAERDHRWDPNAEDAETIEMIRERRAEQVKIANESGIEV